MRLCARLACTKLTLLPRSSTTSRTTDSEYRFWAEFLGKLVAPEGLSVEMVRDTY